MEGSIFKSSRFRRISLKRYNNKKDNIKSLEWYENRPKGYV